MAENAKAALKLGLGLVVLCVGLCCVYPKAATGQQFCTGGCHMVTMSVRRNQTNGPVLGRRFSMDHGVSFLAAGMTEGVKLSTTNKIQYANCATGDSVCINANQTGQEVTEASAVFGCNAFGPEIFQNACLPAPPIPTN